ncbi:vitamin K epoxide reductase family protein [Baekduia soli]|uniref:Vitamin K epoxide reductase family protein n=1 Tax=Baekduia soli TaxID=496014 RepID=A0A5B8U2K3_9ACTN|nr:vitamin K epoxide reductase family protein [Baekduia soli]QEC47095.1 vitamin K epoxide reductase family protein [Baekduia soli]
MSDRTLRITAVVLAVLGVGIAGYLTYIHYAGIEPVCNIAHGCHKVQTSQYADLAGVPVAVLGLLGYVGILAALVVDGEFGRLAAAFFALVGFGFSAYLTYRELFTIDAICQWCIASAILMTALAIVCVWRLVSSADIRDTIAA